MRRFGTGISRSGNFDHWQINAIKPQVMKRREILQTLGLAGLSSTMWTAADFSNIIGYRYVPESLERVRGPVRKLTAITLGAGNRGNVYGD